MFSTTFSTGTRLQNWYTSPTSRRRNTASSSSERAYTSAPFSSTWPEVGRSTPPMRCSRVDLPEPEEPTMATNSPSSTLKDTSSKARVTASPSP